MIEPKPKMKLSHKVWIGIGVTFGLIGICLGIILIWNVAWWLLGVIGGISFLVWIVISTVLIYRKISKKEPETLKINLEDVEELAKYKMKYDTENPDNFTIKKRRLWKIGQPGAERIPILALIGYGSELMEERIILINQKNQNETTILINETIQEAYQEAIRMAENQPDIITKEIVPGGIDEFGRPLPGRMIVKSQSRAEAKEEKEIEKAKEEVTF